MRRCVAGVVGLAVLAALPAGGRDKPPPPLESPLPQLDLPPQDKAPAGYIGPKADGPVVELLDEGLEALLPQLNNDESGESGTAAREDRDVFAGVEAARVTPLQKYRGYLPGWKFYVAEKPILDREFRYLRFAWKKVGGTGIMVQFHSFSNPNWDYRLFAGRNVNNWQPAKAVSEKLPGGWEVVTRDLFKDFGGFTITGIALTPLDGTAGLFDHVLLGRTVEDLDRATAVALGKDKPAGPLAGKERDALWGDLVGTDAKKAAAALRAFLRTAPDQVGFVRTKLGESVVEAPDPDRVRALVAALDADSFDKREAATDELVRIGAAALDPVRQAAAAGGSSDEVRHRCRLILKRLGAGPTAGPPAASARQSRVVRVLERAGTPDARAVLDDVAAGKLADGCAADAKAALARMPKAP